MLLTGTKRQQEGLDVPIKRLGLGDITLGIPSAELEGKAQASVHEAISPFPMCLPTSWLEQLLPAKERMWGMSFRMALGKT